MISPDEVPMVRTSGKRFARKSGEMGGRRRKALLAENRASAMPDLRSLLEQMGFECRIVRSIGEVRMELANDSFDLFASSVQLEGGSAYQTIQLLAGSSCTAFFALPVQRGCFWIPVVDRGKECLGEPALRPGEFREAIKRIFELEDVDS